MKIKFRERRYNAFTLIELMMVMAIIGIMSVVAYATLTGGRPAARLKSAQREVAAVIRLAQGYALQGKTQNGATPCGYGVSFDNNKTTYHIFYNFFDTARFANCDVQNNDSPQERRDKNPNSTNAEDYTLKDGATLSSPNWNRASVFFTVPHGRIFDYSGDEILITNPGLPPIWSFGISGLATTKSITFNPGGYLTESP
jgi:prepilin-type N-terminal cleavage/methylation domain-containing protein